MFITFMCNSVIYVNLESCSAVIGTFENASNNAVL